MPKKSYDQTVGTKYQVYQGIAEQTAGGLLKKDIVRVTKDGVTRYKSKKQQANGKKKTKKSQKVRVEWTNALKKAIKDLRKEGSIADTSILMYKPGKKYEGVKKKKLEDGRKIYKEVQRILKK